MKERMMIQMNMTVLCYKKCSTCQKALKWLDANGIKYEERPIKEEHPSQEELREWYKKSGEWLGDNKPPTFQERLRAQIDAALLQKPADFAAFLLLMEAAGYEVKQGRGGSLSFRAPGQERFTRCRASTLGEGYGPEDIRAIIEGRAPLPSSRATEPVKQGRKLNLIIDIQTRLQGKGPAYERWAKVFNLKQMAAALAYLQDNGLTEYEQLEKKAEQATEHFHTLAPCLEAGSECQ